MKEYRILQCNLGNEVLRASAEEKLNALGREGWQIIAVNNFAANQSLLIYTLERFSNV